MIRGGAKDEPAKPRRLDGVSKQALETGRNRLLVTGVVFSLAFTAVAGRLVDLSILDRGEARAVVPMGRVNAPISGRGDIVDRRGMILATSLPASSLFAKPNEIEDPEAVAGMLSRILPGLSRSEALAKLGGKSRFVWLRRNLTPNQLYQVNRLGIPGLGFKKGERRVYPQGRTAAHVLGVTDIDGRGVAGVEKYFDQLLNSGETLRLSIDLRVQSLLQRELALAKAEFKATGAAGIVLDVRTGETVALVSLPDFDPNDPATLQGNAGFNRVSKGVYEMGSTFKLFNTAMALDTGTVTLNDGYDASEPIRVSRFTISDFHGKNRWLSVPEILIYSSNIGSAKMALDVGEKAQRKYLGRLGLLSQAAIELPEVGAPLTPAVWRDINTMTISYGHGIAVSPLQVATAAAALVNGGVLRPATLLKETAAEKVPGESVLSAETSLKMRRLMRLVVTRGTGGKADVAGYRVGGKTGTADKSTDGGYRDGALISSFVGVFPSDDPRYVLVALLDEPKGTARTFNFATGGWVAAPVVGRMVRAMGPLLGIAPGDGVGQGGDGGERVPLLASAEGDAGEARGRRIETY